MDAIKLKQAILGGLAATIAMTMVMFVAPMMGMPDMKIGNMLASFMAMPLWTGWLMHLMAGLIWATGYVFFVKERLNLNYVLKGMVFALVPWLLMQLMAMPMMGLGIFSSKSADQMPMIAGTLIGHLVYGIVLGITTKAK